MLINTKRNPLISVIIPVYNVENYVVDCIRSVLVQSYKNFEVICIDDCSTDDSLKILNREFGSHEKVHILTNSQNGGLSYSRNVGLEHAKGKYIVFLDSDDYLSNDYFERISIDVSSQHFDVLSYAFNFHYENECTITKRSVYKSDVQYDGLGGIDAFEKFVQNNEMINAVWTRVFKLDMLKKNGIRFINGILFEDIPFTYKALLSANSIYVSNDAYYYYRIRDGSIMRSEVTEQHVKSYFWGYLDSLEHWRDCPNCIFIEEAIDKYLDLFYLKPMQESLAKLGGIPTFDKAVYKHMWSHFNSIKSGELTIDELSLYEDFIIYGTGKNAQKIFNALLYSELCVVGFAESDLKTPYVKWTHQVKRIDDYVSRHNRSCVIIATSEKHYPEIVDNLQKLGFDNYVFSNQILKE